MFGKELPVITISRQYGAGGRSVAKRLHEKLGIPWYDNDFIRKTAADSGIAIQDIVDEGESLSTGEKIIDTLFSGSALYNRKRDDIFQAERQAIINLAVNPCIIIGRCSNVICSDAKINVFRVYLYGDIESRMKRAAELKEYPEGTDIQKFVVKQDQSRANYYRLYTTHQFADPEDYDICLNTGTISYDECAEIICSLIGK